MLKADFKRVWLEFPATDPVHAAALVRAGVHEERVDLRGLEGELEVVPEQRLLEGLAVDERLGRGLRLAAAVPEPALARTVLRLRIPWEREEAASAWAGNHPGLNDFTGGGRAGTKHYDEQVRALGPRSPSSQLWAL